MGQALVRALGSLLLLQFFTGPTSLACLGFLVCKNGCQSQWHIRLWSINVILQGNSFGTNCSGSGQVNIRVVFLPSGGRRDWTFLDGNYMEPKWTSTLPCPQSPPGPPQCLFSSAFFKVVFLSPGPISTQQSPPPTLPSMGSRLMQDPAYISSEKSSPSRMGIKARKTQKFTLVNNHFVCGKD